MSILKFIPIKFHRILPLNIIFSVKKKAEKKSSFSMGYNSRYFKNDVSLITKPNKPISMCINHEE